MLIIITISFLIIGFNQPAFAQTSANISAPRINMSQIVGGSTEDNANFPWVVFIVADIGTCHGTLIDVHWVLTAAHCIVDDLEDPALPIKVSYSRTDPTTGETRSGSQDLLQPHNVIVHEAYEPGREGIPPFIPPIPPKNDIGLIHLKWGLDFTPHQPYDPEPLLQPARLPLPLSSVFTDQRGVVATTRCNGCEIPSGDLAVLRVPISGTTSEKFYLSTGTTILCPGDSGSGYVVGGNGENIVLGVASFYNGTGGTDPCIPPYILSADVLEWYADVYFYSNWIRSKTGLTAPSCCYSMNDILWRNTDGTLAIWRMKGDTVEDELFPKYYGDDHRVGSEDDHRVGSDWKIVGVGKFFSGLYHANEDILWRNDDGRLAIWKMEQGVLVDDTYPTYQSSGTATGNDWKIAGFGDFDGVGTSDILWRHNTGSLAIWFMRDGVFYGEAYPPGPSNDWSIESVADFNGDRFSDILWRNEDGTVDISLSKEGSFEAGSETAGVHTELVGVGLDWQIAGTGDFNGDSRSDILWRNQDGTVAIWLMDGLVRHEEYPSTHYPPIPSQDWQIQKIGDFNGDKKSDILWRNTDGKLRIWFMYGGLIIDQKDPRAVANDWSIIDVGNFGKD